MKAAHFRTQHECNHLVPSAQQPPAALVFNPQAGPYELFAASKSRLDTLRRSLDGWACAMEAEVSALELAQMLLPLAEEIELINEQLEKRLLPLSQGGTSGGAA